MEHGRELIVVLLFATAFLFLLYNPISLSFEVSTLVGLLLLIVFGALIAVGGLLRIPLYYTLPILILAIIDYRMIGVFLFAIIGMGAATEQEKNMVTPNIKKVTKAAFSGFTIFLLFSIIPIYHSAEFEIPPAIMNFVTGRISPLLIGCEASFTGRECIDLHISELIDSQCKGDNQCILLLNDQRAAMEEIELSQFQEFVPSFSLDSSIGDSISDAVNQQIQVLLGPYENIFKILIAAAVFSMFHLFGGIFASLSGLLAFILIKVLMLLKLAEKKTITVDKTIFSI